MDMNAKRFSYGLSILFAVVFFICGLAASASAVTLEFVV